MSLLTSSTFSIATPAKSEAKTTLKLSDVAQTAATKNAQAWDYWAKLHPQTKFYDMPKFKETNAKIAELNYMVLEGTTENSREGRHFQQRPRHAELVSASRP